MPGSTTSEGALEAARHLQTPEAIRERCGHVLSAGLSGDLDHFEVHPSRLPAVAQRVAELTRRRFPDLAIPPHGRWAHFRVGGVDRVARFHSMLADASAEEGGRAAFDLVVTSVLLDAGAGAAWRYRDEETGETFGRSEGLAVASWDAFRSGLFSARPGSPLRADAEGLERCGEDDLARAFQAGPANPLVGLEGRLALMRSLGAAVRNAPDLFGPEGRVGGLYDHLRGQSSDGTLPARTILAAVLRGLGPIWPGRITLGGVNLGDVWPHPHAGGHGPGRGLVPFHKLSQWLTYSMIEPLEKSGLRVVGVGELTALAEYRNGGLLVDGGVLVPRHAAVTEEAHPPDSTVIVEWRALTVALLDQLADEVRDLLGRSEAEMPLTQVIEGGTWQAGRELARSLREDGSPPIRIESDGTVF